MNRSLAAACALALSAAVTAAGAQGDGKAAYDAQCKKCHGATGTPSAAMVKKFKKLATLDAKLLDKMSDDSIVALVSKGKGEMKGLSEKMSPDEIKAAVKYVRSMAAGKP